MSIAGTSYTLMDLLTDQLLANDALLDYKVKLLRSEDFSSSLQNIVSLFLYRVDVDETRRNVEINRNSLAGPRCISLGLELHYLLTIWGGASAEGEHSMLQNCMDIFHRYPILSGPLLSSQEKWDEHDALRLSLAPVTHEDLMRLWDGFDHPYKLSVPYVVKTVRLSPREFNDSVVMNRTLAIGGKLR